MRRTFITLGLSAAALIPLVTGARYVAARTEAWPPPSIVVSPDAGKLAAKVSVADLSDLVLTRLRRFNGEPLYGHRDTFGKDRLKAWTWTYLARAAVRLYRLGHDTRLIDEVLAGASKYEAAAHRHETERSFGWYTEDMHASRAYREVPVSGLIMAPIVDLLLEAKQDRALAQHVAPHRQALLDMLRQAIAGLDKRYIETDGKGYYLLPSGEDVEPLNLMSVYAAPLLGLWRLTQDAESLREATGIARTWKAALSTGIDGGVTWPHTARPPTSSLPPGPPELMIKSSAAIEFPLVAYEAGLVFDRKDIEQLARVPETTLLERVDASHYRLREFVDPGSDSYISVADTGIGTVLRPASWYQYACYNPQQSAVLDPYLFGIDPKFYRLSELALLGLVDRLASQFDPKACGPAGRLALLADH